MNMIELDRALRKLRLSGMAGTLETRLVQAQAEKMAPLDLVSLLVSDELVRREDRLLERRIKQAAFRDVGKSLDNFDFDFNFSFAIDFGSPPGPTARSPSAASAKSRS